MLLNRKKAPAIHTITELNLPVWNTQTIENGTVFHTYQAGKQPVIKLNIVFKGSRWVEPQPLVSRATINMLREGTVQRTAAEIAEYLDTYAGTLRLSDGIETVTLTLFCLKKHLDKLLPLIMEMLLTPSFPDNELKTYTDNVRQELKIDLDKNDLVAYRKTTEMMFGEVHPYGYNSKDEMYATLTRDSLVAFHANNIVGSNCEATASGDIDAETAILIKNHLAQLPKGTAAVYQKTKAVSAPIADVIILKERSLQAALCVARRLFSRQHPDFPAMQVLNCVFGGYFGSRLMSNIREEKGYTYGIYSSISCMSDDGFLMISTEVGKELAEATRTEIWREIEDLQTNLIPDDELEMVRNYMMGQLLQQLDGAFATSEVIREYTLNNLDEAHFDRMIAAIQHTTPEQLRALAQRYFVKEAFYQVQVG